MARLSAIGDAIPNDPVPTEEQELELLCPCKPTSHNFGLGLRRVEKRTAVHDDLPAAVGRLYAHHGGHVLVLLPGAMSCRNAPRHERTGRSPGPVGLEGAVANQMASRYGASRRGWVKVQESELLASGIRAQSDGAFAQADETTVRLISPSGTLSYLRDKDLARYRRLTTIPRRMAPGSWDMAAVT